MGMKQETRTTLLWIVVALVLGGIFAYAVIATKAMIYGFA